MNEVAFPARLAAALGLCWLWIAAAAWSSAAQEAGPAAQPPAEAAPAADAAEAVRKAEAALAAEEPSPETDGEEAPPPDAVAQRVNLLELMLIPEGRWLMAPIAAMSLLVVTFGIERLLALRRRKILPPGLVGGLGGLASQKGGLDPRKAYRLCQQYPSTAAAVIRAMLLKVGRPHAELEHAVSEASEREAARLYVNVRWLSLAAAVTPLMGLLGTVWGMMNAFFVTANLPTGANKAQHLANGIYVALVTTFAGLSVAIPAAILAHLFEGRIQKLFRELDETILGFLPQLERFEGRLRVSRDQLDAPPAAAQAVSGGDAGRPAAGSRS